MTSIISRRQKQQHCTHGPTTLPCHPLIQQHVLEAEGMGNGEEAKKKKIQRRLLAQQTFCALGTSLNVYLLLAWTWISSGWSPFCARTGLLSNALPLNSSKTRPTLFPVHAVCSPRTLWCGLQRETLPRSYIIIPTYMSMPCSTFCLTSSWRQAEMAEGVRR